jgi:hypothetical protein
MASVLNRVTPRQILGICYLIVVAGIIFALLGYLDSLPIPANDSPLALSGGFFAGLIAAAIGMIGAIAAKVVMIAGGLDQTDHPATPPSLNERANSLSSNLQAATELIDEIERQLSSQVAALGRISSQREVAESLAKAATAGAGPVMTLLDVAQRKNDEAAIKRGRRERLINFLLGVLSGLVVGLISGVLAIIWAHYYLGIG